MGIYSQYLDKHLDLDALTKERKTQLKRISSLRGGRDILVYAADINKGNIGAPISIDYSDVLPISDQIANLHGDSLDVILETPGGDGTVAEHIVRMLRERYEDVRFIIPGYAKSAGTIMAMSGDEILMGPTSALGPIDAQLFWQGKVFSAEALIEGLERIKEEVVATGALNKAYIPILQGISPGEIQNARNALDFARVLVTEWLAKYKFRTWKTHRTSGAPVTEEDRSRRAKEIAEELCSHKKWLSHGKSIRISDLRAMRLLITDLSSNADLLDAVQRYHTLLQMTFATNVYKVIETPGSQIYRFVAGPANVGAPQLVGGPGQAVVEVQCGRCKTVSKIQVNFGKKAPIEPGNLPFPPNNRFACPKCHAQSDLSEMRRQVEAQTNQKVVT